MKKLFIFSVFALMGALSSCANEDDPQIGVGVGVNNGGVWIDISFGNYTGGGYYYPNGYPSAWSRSNEFSFVGYIWTNPVANTGRPVFDSAGKPLVGPNGGIVTVEIFPSMMKFLQYDRSKTELVPVVVTMKKDLSGYYYVVQ